MNEGLQLLGGDPSTGKIGAGSWNGHGFNKVESDWQNRVNDEWAKVDPEAREQSALDKGMSELQLPKAAQVYYEKIMREALKNTPINQWDKAISSLNELLIFDDKGNLLRVEPINLGSGDSVVVSKNGVYDAKLTAQANKEYDSKRREQLKEVLPQLVAGVTEVLLGLGINGLDLAGTYFSGGTLALVGASQGAAAVGTTTTVIGAGTVTDAIRKMGVTSGSVSYSFANNYNSQLNKPTSKSFGKKVSGRVNGRKVDNIRVDAEPHSGKVQVQSGGGKSGYNVDLHMKMSDITNKKSISDWINKQSELNGLGKGAKEQIVNNMWKAYKWLVE